MAGNAGVWQPNPEDQTILIAIHEDFFYL